jgi:hypothetical protein
LPEPVGTSFLGRRDDSTGLVGTGSVGIVARSRRLSVVGFEECGLAGASIGELVVHGDDGSFHGRRRPFEAGVGRSGASCASLRAAGQAGLTAARTAGRARRPQP